MSGWDDSRSTWEPESQRPDGVPQNAPGAPPGVFDPDYDSLEPDYGPPTPGQQPYGEPGYAREEFAPRDAAGPGAPADPVSPAGPAGPSEDPGGQDDYGYGYGRHGRQAAAREERAWRDFQQQRQEDYPQQPGYQGQGRDYVGRDYAGRDAAGRDTVDPYYAARMDPALQDFFAPLPPRADFATREQQPGPHRAGQPVPARPTKANELPDARPGQPGRPGPGQPGQPWTGEHAVQDGRWEAAAAPRPGSRTARRRQDRPSSRRGLVVASAVCVLVVLGIVVAAYLLLRKPATPAASSTPPPSPKASPSASHQTSSTNTTAAAYTLSTPATAGGYPQLATPATAVSNVATATATAVRGLAAGAGGKVTGQAGTYYQLSSGQVMSFAGYEGTFDPAKVIAALGAGWQAFPAGSHGGDLSCAPSTGTPGGTVCAWVTTSTVGVTEFFSSSGAPETVTDQAKAAQDTVNVRANVEAAKS
jgi:hypothetical protein